jgi:hypothetical protein
MKVKEVLDIWTGWDSPDIFVVEEIASDGKRVALREMTGLELVTGPLGDREIKRFGSYGKGADGTWRHHASISALHQKKGSLLI